MESLIKRKVDKKRRRFQVSGHHHRCGLIAKLPRPSAPEMGRGEVAGRGTKVYIRALQAGLF